MEGAARTTGSIPAETFATTLARLLTEALIGRNLIRRPGAGEKVNIEAAVRMCVKAVIVEHLPGHESSVRELALQNIEDLRESMPDSVAEFERRVREIIDAQPGSDLFSTLQGMVAGYEERGRALDALQRGDVPVDGKQEGGPADKRAELLAAVAELNDEAFIYIAIAMLPEAMFHGARTQIWPDGLGGFIDREKIERVRVLAAEFAGFDKQPGAEAGPQSDDEPNAGPVAGDGEPGASSGGA